MVGLGCFSGFHRILPELSFSVRRSEERNGGGAGNGPTYSVPLSTIWVSREMPSRLMNSWAKVMSRDALARSFRASSLASMLDDWMRSCSWTAVWYWEWETAPASVLARSEAQVLLTCRPTYRGGGQTQDGAVLDVVAILRRT